MASLRWIVRNRAWNWWYLIRYWRFMMFRLRNPHVITEGFVFIGKNVEIDVRRDYGRLILGKWVHLGQGNELRVHEGTLRIGDKCVFGRHNTINTYLDVEFGHSCIVADWVYVGDFDHVFADVTLPIKDQGIVKTPVRIGPDCWIGTKVSILRGTTIGHGAVLGANSVVRGQIPPMSVVGGIPARILKDRRVIYLQDAVRRDALADISRKTAVAAEAVRQSN